MRKTKHVIFVIILLLIFSSTALASGIMRLKDIEAGMRGRGKTVFQGTTVEDFPVEIISIIENQGLDQELILVKTSGKKMENIGGIAAGMSGSPVYINDKLLGAIGYSWSDGSGLYGLVTPIKRMLKLFSNDHISGGKSLTGNREISFNLGDNIARVNAPLMVSGMNGRALERLKKDMKEYGIRVIPGGDEKSAASSSGRIKPGSAIAVQLVKGDINISSIGTITYIKDDKILAFGHPFTNKGKVSYLLSEAYINATIPNDKQPFKLGAPIDRPLGIINVDRGAGIAGEMREFPEIIPFKVNVTDSKRGITKTARVQIIKDEKLLPSLAVNTALQSIDSVIDRLGKGMAEVELSIMGNGLPGFEVERKNIFYSGSDIAGRSLYDFYRLLELITTNPFEKVNIISLNLDLEISKKEKIAFLKEVKVLNKRVNPGDKLKIEIIIQPYRKEAFSKEIMVKLPEDIDPGMSNIVISGGFTGESYRPSAYGQQSQALENGEIKETSINGYEDLNEMIEGYLKTPKNNEIIVQIYPGYPSATAPPEAIDKKDSSVFEEGKDNKDQDKEQQKQSDEDKTKDDNEQKESSADQSYEPEIKELFETEYILEGSLNLNVEIEKEQKDEIEIIDSNLDDRKNEDMKDKMENGSENPNQ